MHIPKHLYAAKNQFPKNIKLHLLPGLKLQRTNRVLWGLELPGNQDELEGQRKASDTDRGPSVCHHLICLITSNWNRTSRRRSRSKSPQMQKVPVLKGSDSPNWESFIYQFERVAAQRRWSATKKAYRLLDCLED